MVKNGSARRSWRGITIALLVALCAVGVWFAVVSGGSDREAHATPPAAAKTAAAAEGCATPFACLLGLEGN
jgi:hypothetical protein